MGTPTRIDVRVLARGGKFLGDDIGGALVTIHDVHTGELLAQGTTSGGSGVADLMTVCRTRAQVWPVEGASVFTVTLGLERPRLLKIAAYGPLAAPQAANTVTATQWVYPGRDVTGGAAGGGLFLEIPGLAVQIRNPPTHFLPAQAPRKIKIRANVTMMCGCPIGPAHPPWLPEHFAVTAAIWHQGHLLAEHPLHFDADARDGAPSQFVYPWRVPENTSGTPQIYEMRVVAFQPETGNTGVDTATVIIPAASAS